MNKPWLAHYPEGVPTEINTETFTSLGQFLESSFEKHAQNPFSVCMERWMSFAELDRHSAAMGAWLQQHGLASAARLALMLLAIEPRLRGVAFAWRAPVLGWLLVCALYATLARATWLMLEIVHDEKSPILQIPGSATYACVMGGMAMLALLASHGQGVTSIRIKVSQNFNRP